MYSLLSPKVLNILDELDREEEKNDSIENLIEEAYWYDVKTGKKTNLMDSIDNDIWFYIKFKKEAIGKTFKAQLACKSIPNGISNIGVSIIKEEKTFVKYNLSLGKDFIGLKDNIQSFFYIIKMDNEKVGKTYPLSQNDYLKVHIIRYIPQIMRNQNPKWEVAYRTQREWFEGKANDKPWRASPKQDFVSMEWVLNFERMKKQYYEEVLPSYNTENAIKQLKKRIKEQQNDPDVQLKLPLNIGGKVKFGTYNNKLKDYPNIEQPKLNGNEDWEIMPIFERYYYQNIGHALDKTLPNLEPLDDLFGTFGACQFRIVASGEIEKIANEKYEITITQIGIYIKDSFDFITEDEYLGHWSLLKNDVSRLSKYVPAFDNYYVIKNDDYQNYRKDYDIGGDYNIYSSVKTENVNYKFFALETEIKQ